MVKRKSRTSSGDGKLTFFTFSVCVIRVLDLDLRQDLRGCVNIVMPNCFHIFVLGDG